MKYVCAGDICTQSELYDLIQEMDRRYYLVQDLRWEFSLLDREQKDTITEEQARYNSFRITFEALCRKKTNNEKQIVCANQKTNTACSFLQ